MSGFVCGDMALVSIASERFVVFIPIRESWWIFLQNIKDFPSEMLW